METIKTVMRIKLDSIDDVKEFVNRATMCKFDIDLTSDRYVIDAKSIMGIFSLDLSKPINLDVEEEYSNSRDLFLFDKWKVKD